MIITPIKSIEAATPKPKIKAIEMASANVPSVAVEAASATALEQGTIPINRPIRVRRDPSLFVFNNTRF